MKILDKKTFLKINQYNYFRTFDDPSYGFNKKIDVTKIVEYKDKTGIGFFIPFIYLVTLAMNSVYEFHLREINDEIVYFDMIQPTFTVMSHANNVFYNARCDISSDLSFKKFAQDCREEIEKYKYSTSLQTTYNDEDYAVYYISCSPLISLESMTHPTPSKNYTSLSVPRVFWDKYRKEGDKYYVSLNITVSHTLVDGIPLSNAFLKLEEMIENLDQYLI